MRKIIMTHNTDPIKYHSLQNENIFTHDLVTLFATIISIGYHFRETISFECGSNKN